MLPTTTQSDELDYNATTTVYVPLLLMIELLVKERIEDMNLRGKSRISLFQLFEPEPIESIGERSNEKHQGKFFTSDRIQSECHSKIPQVVNGEGLHL